MKAVRLRPEVFVVALSWAILSVPGAVQWLGAVAFHELGHGVVGRLWAGKRPAFDLQLGAADAYFAPDDTSHARCRIVATGLFASALFAVAMGRLGADPTPAWTWTAYQAFVFPASDGGVLLRERLVRRGLGPIEAFRWARRASLAAALVVGSVLWAAAWMQAFAAALFAVALALVVAETEWPALVHLAAYRAWREGRHEEVLEWAFRMKRGAPRLLEHVRELGVRSAMACDRVEAVEELGRRLPSGDPVRLEAAEWALRRDLPVGARWAEDALEDFDRAPSRHADAARDRLRELALAFALYEARQGRLESGAGLVERACGLGPVSFDWLEFAEAGRALLQHPRVARIRD